MFTGSIAAGHYSEEAREINLKTNWSGAGAQPICEYWNGRGANLLNVQSALNSFKHNNFLHGRDEEPCLMRIKVYKNQAQAIMDEKNKDNEKLMEISHCKAFSDMVSLDGYNRGFQNIYHTYSDSESRYFIFIFNPVSFLDGSILDIQRYIEMTYQDIMKYAYMCFYEKPEVTVI